jgi:hypothetical protein
MKRRKFIKTAGSIAVLSPVIPVAGNESSINAHVNKTSIESFASTIKVIDNQIFIETLTLSATITDGFLTSLKSKQNGEEFIVDFDTGEYVSLQLIYPRSEVVDINESNYGKISLHQISDQQAEIVFHSWNGDGVISVQADDETGDLIIEPSAYTSRPGVLACRWNIPGIRHDLQLVAPFFQGTKLRMDDPLINDQRWMWPMFWEAGLAILQGNRSGFFIHTQDAHYTYKALKTGSQADPFMLGLDTEAYGPIDNNLAAGGLRWRINVYQGEWQVPATKYRDWLWNAFGLKKEEEKRKTWIHEIRFAVSWCPGDTAILNALAKRIPPSRILIHYPGWRTDIYDQNYPNYVASEKGRSFIQECRKMGFHIMPHFNSVDMDPSHPAYTMIRDFQYRDIEQKHLMGWSWVDGKVLGVPESNESRIQHRDKNVMIKVHPGSSIWRSILGENILKASTDLDLDCAFIDVTLVTQNLHNCLVENITSSEGMKRLIDHVGHLGKGLVVGGEGLNEITMQGLSFAQAHLFKSWQTSVEGLERTGGCNLNQLLFGRLCNTFGYSGLSGKDEDEALRMQLQVEHGSIPTITIHSAEEIIKPNPAVKHMMELATS